MFRALVEIQNSGRNFQVPQTATRRQTKRRSRKHWELSKDSMLRYYTQWRQGRSRQTTLTLIRSKARFLPQSEPVSWEEVEYMWRADGLPTFQSKSAKHVRVTLDRANQALWKKWQLPVITLRAAAMLYIIENDIDLKSFAAEIFDSDALTADPSMGWPQTKPVLLRRCWECGKVTCGGRFCNDVCKALKRRPQLTKHCCGCQVVFQTPWEHKKYCTAACRYQWRYNPKNPKRTERA